MGLFTDALHFAVDAHGDARRKGDGAPAILHATEAASIATTLTTDERVLAAAVLHDTVEAAGVLPDEIRERFGDRVAELVAAETDTSFVLYDDDGHTEDYKNGVYAKTTIDVKAGDRTDIHFSTEGTYESPVERMTIKLVSKKKGAFWASVDGEQLTRYIVRDGWEEAESGWYYNLSDRTIWVKFNKPAKKDFTVTISTEKFDLIGMAED